MLEQLYTNQYQPFLKWVLKNSGNAEDAEDAYHSAWAVCYSLFEVRTDIDSLTSYLKVCCRNEYLKICRHRGKNLPFIWENNFKQDDFEADEAEEGYEALPMGSPASDDDFPDLNLSEQEELAKDTFLYQEDNWGIIRKCLQYLNERYRIILTLWFTLWLKYGETANKGSITKEIAEIIGTTEGSVHEGKSKGMEQLRHELIVRFPEQVRYLKWKYAEHQKNLKNKKVNDPSQNQA